MPNIIFSELRESTDSVAQEPLRENIVCKKKGPNRSVRSFVLMRDEDESGISGTGIVAEGAEFSNGQCALIWLTPYASLAFYPSIKALEAIHGHGGKTRVVWET